MKFTTGKVSNVNINEVTTVCIPNDALEVTVLGPYREVERKLWAYLIHNACESDSFGQSKIHEAKCSDVKNVFQALTGHKDNKVLWQYIENLGDIKVCMKSGDSYEGFSHLLSFAEVNYSKDLIRYQIPVVIEQFLTSEKMAFARIRTHFLIGLKGKYSVSLYMLLEQYANRRHPSLTLTIDEIREKLQVEPAKFEKWADLKRRVLLPAIDEINQKTKDETLSSIPSLHGAGFSVSFEPNKSGQGVKVKSVKFTIEKNEKRSEWEDSLKRTSKKTSSQTKLTLKWPIVISLLKKHGIKDIDKYAYYDEWSEWLRKSNKTLEVSLPEASYVGFIKKKVLHGA